MSKKIRTAAYCRVSSDHDEQGTSLELQMRYYTDLIEHSDDKTLVCIYSEQVSGTNIKERPVFQKLIRDCRMGKIDLILVKSISRFSRNTFDTLKIANELYHLGVRVEFEEEGINNFDKEMRAVMTVCAAVAQSESYNMSKNIQWGIRQKMRSGGVCLNCTRFLGYTKDADGRLVIVEEEAEIVRKIFDLYVN